MTIHALVTGTIFRDPEQRTSKSGTPFTSATVKVKDGDDVQWWKVLAFHETAQAELMRLSDGEAVWVQEVRRIHAERPRGARESDAIRRRRSGASPAAEGEEGEAGT